MGQSQEILLGHAIFASIEYRMTHADTVVLHMRLAIKKVARKLRENIIHVVRGGGGWLIQARAGTVLNRTSAEIVFMAHSSLRY